jgi:hypothetical protein
VGFAGVEKVYSDHLTVRSHSCTTSVAVALLIPSTFGGLFNLFALSLACHSANGRLDGGHFTFLISKPTQARRKRSPEAQPGICGVES